MIGQRLANLVGVCHAIQFESPSSWITRAALGQGVPTPELASYLGWAARPDLDQTFAIMYSRGLPKDAAALAGLEVARRVLIGYQRSGCRADRMFMAGQKRRWAKSDNLLPTVRKRGQYRFCPACLQADMVPFMRQEWRFNCWRYCPKHLCLLEDCCPHCSAALELPVSLIGGGSKSRGVANLSYCVRCGGSLSAVTLKTLGPSGRGGDSWAITHLQNGRAAVAAMYYARVRVVGEAEDRPLQHLRMLENIGLFPTGEQATLAERGLPIHG